MKLLYGRWRSYLTEQNEGPDADMTWQELATAIEAAQAIRAGEMDKERERALTKTLGRSAIGLVSILTGGAGGLAIAAGATVGDVATGLFKTYIQQDDKKTPDNPLLKAFNLSDGFQELIDDRLEDEFIEDILPRIERMAVEAPAEVIPNMDKIVQDWLAKRKIGGTIGNTVTKSSA